MRVAIAISKRESQVSSERVQCFLSFQLFYVVWAKSIFDLISTLPPTVSTLHMNCISVRLLPTANCQSVVWRYHWCWGSESPILLILIFCSGPGYWSQTCKINCSSIDVWCCCVLFWFEVRALPPPSTPIDDGFWLIQSSFSYIYQLNYSLQSIKKTNSI